MQKQGKDELYNWLVEKTQPIRNEKVGSAAKTNTYSTAALFVGLFCLCLIVV